MKYQYKCDRCDNVFEIHQSIKDKPLTICGKCKDNTLYRVINKPIVVYNCNGFYCKDNKK